MARLTADQWRAIRQVWEFDPDSPSYTEAASLAAKKHGFKSPSKPAVGKRALIEKWERRGCLAGINQAAHRIADRIGAEAEHKLSIQGGGAAYNDPGIRPDGPSAEYEERSAAELRRAEIRIRHRREWEQVASLRQEALECLEQDVDKAFNRLKSVKITAEIVTLQQAGEIKSWGMDELIDQTRLKSMSDGQLEKIISGRRLS